MKLVSILLCLLLNVVLAQTNQSSEHSVAHEAVAHEVFDDISIVVFSCDKYQELWSPFFELLFKNWPSLKTSDSQVPIYLVANSKKYDDPRVISVNIQNETSWSDNALIALALVKTKYVLVVLEDYFFTHIDTKRLHEILNFMRAHDVSYCQISCSAYSPMRKKAEVLLGVAEKERFELWRTSLHACIWRTKDMMHVLKPGESIWEFEVAGTVRSQGLYGKFLTVFENHPMEYLNMVKQGYLDATHLQTIKDMGITFNRVNLEVDSDHKFKLWLYYRVFNGTKEFVKKSVNALRGYLRSFVRRYIPGFDSN